jgi:NTP pyrophosphatase (non-canonical NTP hydrolase)
MTGHVAALVAWFDSVNPRTPHESAMRIMKIGEEFGEVAEAYAGMYGQNPRKGVTHTLDDVCSELCDVIVTAMVALATVAGDADKAAEVIDAHLSARFERLVARIPEAGEPRG